MACQKAIVPPISKMVTGFGTCAKQALKKQIVWFSFDERANFQLDYWRFVEKHLVSFAISIV